ncbi:unnamed protein product [Ilex paraguariensis]|uniref:Heme-binding protein 2 n=1 Tax=Ilex paraguariensis TaxID=185542 RepID=A0ABC8S4I6_9AQUA
MAVFNLFKLSMLLSLLSNSNGSKLPEIPGHHVGELPLPCSSIECPGYDTIHSGNGYEIRRYNSSVWMSTAAIEDISIVEGTRTGFLQLFDYIQGNNNYSEKIEMTAPVLTEVSPSDGPFCATSFVVSFYVPKENQPDPPPAEGLHVQKWDQQYVAVRQFGGFVSDLTVGEEAAALQESLFGTVWSAAIEKSHAGETATIYSVAQYNSPFEFDNRVNEIWFLFSMEDEFAV